MLSKKINYYKEDIKIIEDMLTKQNEKVFNAMNQYVLYLELTNEFKIELFSEKYMRRFNKDLHLLISLYYHELCIQYKEALDCLEDKKLNIMEKAEEN